MTFSSREAPCILFSATLGILLRLAPNWALTSTAFFIFNVMALFPRLYTLVEMPMPPPRCNYTKTNNDKTVNNTTLTKKTNNLQKAIKIRFFSDKRMI